MNQPANQPEYVLPDPRLQRAALVTVVTGTLVGALAIAWFVPWLERTLLLARAQGTLTFPLACFLFLALVLALAVPVIWFGVYAARFGARVVAAAQYPPPGARVLRRTPVVRGRVAVVSGRGQQVLGIALLLCGFALVVLVGWGLVAIWR